MSLYFVVPMAGAFTATALIDWLFPVPSSVKPTPVTWLVFAVAASVPLARAVIWLARREWTAPPVEISERHDRADVLQRMWRDFWAERPWFTAIALCLFLAFALLLVVVWFVTEPI